MKARLEVGECQQEVKNWGLILTHILGKPHARELTARQRTYSW